MTVSSSGEPTLYLQGLPVDETCFARGFRRAPPTLQPGWPGRHVRRRLLRGTLPNDDMRVRRRLTG
jgi:hypothetical protein